MDEPSIEEKRSGPDSVWADSLTRYPRVVLLGIACLSLVAAVWAFNPRTDLWDDNAEYIVLARSILQGRWMQFINQPDSPRAERYAFGLPLLLAGIEALAPGNMLAMKVFVLVLFVFAMPVVYLLLRRALPGAFALAATILTLLDPCLLPFSHQVMSEVPYLLASLLALICLERAEEPAEAGRVRYLVAGALLAVAATTIRVIGLSLFAGAALWYLLRKEYRRGLVVAGVYLTVVLGLEVLGIGVIGPSYVQKALHQFRFGHIAERLLSKLSGFAFIPKAFFPTLQTSSPIVVVAMGMVLIGFLGVALRRMLVPCYLLVYVGLLAAWPSGGPQDRYLVPLTPFLLLCFFSGVSVATGFFLRWPRKLRPYAGPLVKGIVLLTAGVMMIFYLFTLADTKDDYSRLYGRGWESYFEAAEWLRENSPSEAIVAARRPFLLHLASQRKTIRVWFSVWTSSNPGLVLKHLTHYRVTFVVVDSLNDKTRRYLVPTINAHPELFAMVHITFAMPPTYVFRIKDRTPTARYALRP